MTARRRARQRCRYGIRHWFAYHGWVGSSSPVCTRGCGTPNPRYRPEDDPKREGVLR